MRKLVGLGRKLVGLGHKLEVLVRTLKEKIKLIISLSFHQRIYKSKS